MKSYLLYFLVGGGFTTLVMALENNGSWMLSGFAMLAPVFTLVAYFFIGESQGAAAVSQHAWFVLAGTFAAWAPYMATVAYLAPRIGPRAAIGAGLATFFVLAAIFLSLARHFHWFGE